MLDTAIVSPQGLSAGQGPDNSALASLALRTASAIQGGLFGVGRRDNSKFGRIAFARCRTIQQLFGETCLVDGHTLIVRQASQAFLENAQKQYQIFRLTIGPAIVHHRLPSTLR